MLLSRCAHFIACPADSYFLRWRLATCRTSPSSFWRSDDLDPITGSPPIDEQLSSGRRTSGYHPLWYIPRHVQSVRGGMYASCHWATLVKLNQPLPSRLLDVRRASDEPGLRVRLTSISTYPADMFQYEVLRHAVHVGDIQPLHRYSRRDELSASRDRREVRSACGCRKKKSKSLSKAKESGIMPR